MKILFNGCQKWKGTLVPTIKIRATYRWRLFRLSNIIRIKFCTIYMDMQHTENEMKSKQEIMFCNMCVQFLKIILFICLNNFAHREVDAYWTVSVNKDVIANLYLNLCTTNKPFVFLHKCLMKIFERCITWCQVWNFHVAKSNRSSGFDCYN